MNVTSNPDWDQIPPERPVVTNGGLVDDQTHGNRNHGGEDNHLRYITGESELRSLYDV